MRVLLIGSGAREHALATALAQDPAVEHLIATPGNPGIATVATKSGAVELRAARTDDPAAAAALASEVSADLVVVGPEAPLVAGVADAVREAGIACFGPSAAAARLEGSKAFAKDVMAAAKAPTARARTCRDEVVTGRALDEFGPPYVVKHDGLAAGKGVVVTEDRATALAHAAASSQVVVEEFLEGPEVSLFVIADGSPDGAHAVPLLPAQDFKRIGDGDTGPNTGGMGAYAPLPWAPPGLVEQVLAQVVRPTLAEMSRRGAAFSGLLYCGLVLTADGPKVIEFNCRFGDPETQAVLALLDTPLATLLHGAAVGQLAGAPPLRWRDGAAVTVVVASEGYPAAPRTGFVIAPTIEAPAVVHAPSVSQASSVNQAPSGIHHAGTARREDGALVTAGGRVLSCTATGPDLARARLAAYDLVDTVHWEGKQHRRDIAHAAAEGMIHTPF